LEREKGETAGQTGWFILGERGIGDLTSVNRIQQVCAGVIGVRDRGPGSGIVDAFQLPIIPILIRRGISPAAAKNVPGFGDDAAHCGMSVNILRKWIREEKFPAAKDPGWMTTTAKIAERAEGKVGGEGWRGAIVTGTAGVDVPLKPLNRALGNGRIYASGGLSHLLSRGSTVMMASNI